MAYKRVMRRRPPKKKGLLGLLGLGDTYNDETPCSNIPAGDPYRKPGNYCATAEGGYSTFKENGDIYTASDFPGGGSSSSSFWDVIGKALSQGSMFGGAKPPTPAPTGMSTTTKVALAAGGALVLVLLLKD